MDDLVTGLTTEIDGVTIEYGRIPSGIIDGWDGIVYYFQTNISEDELVKDKYESIIQKVISKLESQSFDHWSEWRETRKEIIFDKYYQITLVSFRVKDSY